MEHQGRCRRATRHGTEKSLRTIVVAFTPRHGGVVSKIEYVDENGYKMRNVVMRVPVDDARYVAYRSV